MLVTINVTGQGFLPLDEAQDTVSVTLEPLSGGPGIQCSVSSATNNLTTCSFVCHPSGMYHVRLWNAHGLAQVDDATYNLSCDCGSVT